MDTFDQFLNYFGNGDAGKFWKTITKSSLVPLNNTPDKKTFLKELYEEIVSGVYLPDKPRGYIVINKGRSVVRLIPVFCLRDTCVYFYCTKKVENEIYGNRVPNTFGGWSLGGQIRKIEREELQHIISNLREYEMPDGSIVGLDESSEYSIPASFNPSAWKENWSEYMRALYAYSRADIYEYVAELDIANFYDNINVNTVIEKIKNQSTDSEIVDLLSHFLKEWGGKNNPILGVSNKGIPQDETADCSRIIANFYLQEFDEEMFKLCDKYGAKYFRYADDQIILAPSEEILQEIISLASVKILKYGLCFNNKKVMMMNKAQFENYFSFEWFINRKDVKELDASTLKKDIEYYKDNKNYLRNDGVSVIQRILNLAPQNIDKDSVNYLKTEIISLKFLASPKLEVWHLKKLYILLDSAEQKKFIKELKDISKSILYNRYLFVVKSFFESIGENTEEINSRIDELYSLFGLEINKI